MDEVVDFESSEKLTDAQKLVLRLHRVFLTHPAGLSSELRESALVTFSVEQVAELALKFIWWTTNRATVTLGDDGPHAPDALTSFHFDADGRYVVHHA
jgi:hypothetical protein